MLQLLIAATNRDDDAFNRAADEIMASDHGAERVLTRLSIRATNLMLQLSETSMLACSGRPEQAARAELAERLEWRLLNTLNESSADR